ncbi:rhomboid family intramembrane serine protease [Iamia sp. SCSIO 61187]|uniref:rhomboid family intramembrane serine protease n=1 Tax=Iamia sp. SCSIO 61187 TaxID=2722752 RepID=UPI001C6317BA|nr:rhomboid family intramembrane serine protease [Iamia sp. SCSIO 61187]QYG94572.1 rhomboid family intramembrane serine protease [Iamia sp. SCSIO 61187]
MTAPTNVRTCYRHPDRMAGISCQRCDRPICPACMRQASVGFHCPDCAAQGKQRVYQGVAALVTRPIATQVLIAINVLAFAAMLATSALEPFSAGGKAIALARDDNGLFADGALFGPFVPDEPWRIVTGGFLHSNGIPFGFLHLAMNMYFIWILGQMLESALGRTRFVALYALALIGGSLGVLVLDPTAVTIGASGAAYGLMGAAFFVARDRNIDLMRSGLVTTLGINLLLTFSIPGISIGGHVGGLVAGGLGGLVLVEGSKRLGPKGGLVASGITVALTVVLALVAYGLMVGEYGDIIIR